jgi:putative ABC transport system permease protein
MLKHYWNTALRNLFRNKLFTFINVIGLSISIAIFLSLTAYVQYQFSFDKFYEGGDRIYRINYYEYQQGQPVLQSARTHDRTGLLVHEYAPQVEAMTRVYNEKAFVFTEDVRIVDQDMLFADSSFFKVFSVKLLSGSSANSLQAPHSVMISKSQAAVYFGSQDPVGKTIFFNERLPVTITGVFEDIPSNSSLDFDFLLSWSTMSYYGWVSKDGTFSTPWTFTFVKLKENITDIPSVNKALTRMATDHITTLEKRGHTARYELQSYQDLHTASSLSGEVKPSTSKTLLYALVSLAAFILVAAWINYINLSLARSLERADEIGIRKVFGATRFAISGQFMLEAFILSFVTFFIGYGLYAFFTGPFSYLVFTNVSFFTGGIGTRVLYFTGFVVGTTLIAFYPTHVISRFKPVLILKNKLGSGKGKAALLQQGLMVFQLFLAVAIVGITLIAGRQINFIRSFDSGFNAQQTITLRAPASTNSDSLRYTRYRTFRNEVLQNAAFRSGTASMNIPGQEIRFHDEDVHPIGSKNEKKQSFWVMWIDEGYPETFGLTLAGGRNFNVKEPGATCLINETAALALGYKTPVDAVNTVIFTSDQKPVTVVGVLKDYHHESIRKPVEPILFFHHHPHEYGYYSFKVQSRQGNYLQGLEKIWHKHYPNDQFIYYFMDRFFEEQYQSDEFFTKLLKLFSIISIAVASLGLFGMASLAMVKRTKEIAVRKVLGARVSDILLMISRNYVRLIAISCAFAFPLAYYVTDQWLNGFAYKIDVHWWMIIMPGAIVLLTTLLTIAAQSIRAAIADPARSLRDQ